jgi:CBS domain-containing protein
MQVSEIMTRRVDLVDPNATIRDAARIMRDENHGALPVAEKGKLVGMVTDRDIAVRAVAENRRGGTTSVRQVMSQNVYCCHDSDDVEKAAEIMAEHQVRRVPVLNDEDRVCGIVALADLARNDPDSGEKALEGVSEPNDQPRR